MRINKARFLISVSSKIQIHEVAKKGTQPSYQPTVENGSKITSIKHDETV